MGGFLLEQQYSWVLARLPGWLFFLVGHLQFLFLSPLPSDTFGFQHILFFHSSPRLLTFMQLLLGRPASIIDQGMRV